MEFNEKLQTLRKQKGLTQEELAQKLFVSRTAISKWESGRGYPNIDSLKQLARFFSVSVDELLSCEQVLTIAEDDRKESRRYMQDLVYGVLDLSAVLLLFLPFFGQESDSVIQAVSLAMLTQIAPWLKGAYWALVIGMAALGLLALVLQSKENIFWKKHKTKLSFALNMLGALLFILSRQPYPATLLFVFLTIKVFLSAKNR